MLTDEQVTIFVSRMREYAEEANKNAIKYMHPLVSSLLNDAIGTRNTFDFVADFLEETNALANKENQGTDS